MNIKFFDKAFQYMITERFIAAFQYPGFQPRSLEKPSHRSAPHPTTPAMDQNLSVPGQFSGLPGKIRHFRSNEFQSPDNRQLIARLLVDRAYIGPLFIGKKGHIDGSRDVPGKEF